MTYSILKNGYDLFPVANKNYFVVKSSNFGEERFEYIADIKAVFPEDCSQFPFNSMDVARLSQSPSPSGESMIEVNNVLKDFLEYDIRYSNFNYTVCNSNCNWLLYTIDFGEKYVKKWVANDFVFVTATTPGLSGLCLTTDGTYSYVGGPTFSNETHGYSVDDLISVVSSEENFVRSGKWRITEVISDKTVRLNQFFQNSGTPSFGFTTSYADKRQTEFLGITESGLRYLFNGALTHDEWVYFNEDDWIVNAPPFGTGGRLLTNIPPFDCQCPPYLNEGYGDKWDHLYYYTDEDFFTAGYWVRHESDIEAYVIVDGVTYSIPLDNNSVEIGTIGFGPQNLIEGGLDPSIFLGKDYIFYLVSDPDCCLGDNCSLTTQKILMKWRKLDCSIKTENYKILFSDAKGGWATHNFNLLTTSRLEVSRKVFDGELLKSWNDVESDFCIDPRRPGKRSIKNDYRKLYTVKSDFLEEEQVTYLEDLIKSRHVFHLKKDSNGNYYPYPINIIDNSYNSTRTIQTRWRTLDITFEYANKDDII
jgi:hypothetical protein